jgi:hypothetical protein
MSTLPDKSPDGMNLKHSFTILFIPSNGYFEISGNKVHSDMLRNLGYDNKKQILKRYKEENPEEDLIIIPSRWDYQQYGDVYLARVSPVFGKDYMEVSIWQPWRLDILKDSTMKEFLGKIYGRIPESALENYGTKITKALVHIPTSTFDKNLVLRGKQDYRYYPVKTVLYSLTPTIKKIKNNEEPDVVEKDKKDKIYIIKGLQYKLSELEKRRSKVHLFGSGVVDEVLCSIDIKAYPELEGYVPNNCLGKKVKMEPYPQGVSRGEGDWRLLPKWRATSENYSFRVFLASKIF